MTNPGGTKRRLLGLARLAVFVVILCVTLTLLTQSLQDNDSYASILSGIATIITLFLALFDHLRRQDAVPPVDEAIEDLRMRLLNEWEPELRRRVQRFPHERTIPLEWKKYRGTGPSPLDGRFEGDPDEAAEQLARRFDEADGKKRMVVLGEPGAGKTFIAIALTVGLLRHWTEDKPLAVYLSLSTWDPVVDALDDWMIYTVASAYYSGDQRTPTTLLRARRLLPVLDGLDELPEHLRRLAVRRINDSLTGDRMLVVTCRTAEYEDVLAGGAPSLLRAPAVEVRPVTARDVLSRLKDVPAWANVVRHVEKNPSGPLATALSTPLMLSLFSAVYLERDPAELLDESKYGSRHAVEDAIVDMRLDTAYPADRTRGRWSSDRARKWLAFLARQMHEHDERDITWRKLAYRAGSAATPLIAAVVLGGIVLFWLSAALPSSYSPMSVKPINAVSLLTDLSPLTSVLLGAVAAATWLSFRRPLVRTRPDQHHRRMRGFNRGMVIGSTAVLVPGYVLAVVSPETNAYSASGVIETSAVYCATAALALVTGLGVGLHEMLVEHTAAKRTAPGSRHELSRERNSAFLAAAAAGLVIGTLSVLATIITTELGAHLGQRFARSMGLDTVADLEVQPLGFRLSWVRAEEYLQLLVQASSLVALLLALVLSATRAWPRLMAARIKLALNDRLPWKLRRFISDATELGLLRRAGSAHQFGHVLLQERLVATTADDVSARRGRWPRIAGLGAVSLLVVAGAAGAAWSGSPAACRPTKWAGVDARMTRTTIGQDSACFAYVDQKEWEQHLSLGQADVQVLADIKAQQAKIRDLRATGRGAVSIAGEFNLLSPAEWHEILVGVAAAQQVSKGSVVITFVYADLEGNYGPEAADLLDLYLRREENAGKVAWSAGAGIGAVDLRIRSSRVVGDGYSATQIVSTNDQDLDRRVKERQDRAALDWLYRPEARASRSIPPADALVDDIESDLCADLKAARQYPLGFDMRKAQMTSKLLRDMAACGGASVLVKPEDLPALTALPNRPREVKINYVNDRSETMSPDCKRVLGANASADSMKSCVAVVAANESFRVAVEQLPDQETP